MRFWRFVAFAISIVCLGTAAVAQESAKLGPQAAEIETEGVSKGDAARATMYTFARCVVHRHRKESLQWLSLPADDPMLTKKAYNFVDDTCLGNGELRFVPLLFRDALYAALYHEQFGEKAAPLNSAATVVAAGNSAIPVHDMLSEFADCVVHRDPSTVRVIVLAPPGSPRESQALTSLSPQFQLCLVKDARLELNKTTLTGALAEALYRASIATLTPAAGGASL